MTAVRANKLDPYGNILPDLYKPHDAAFEMDAILLINAILLEKWLIASPVANSEELGRMVTEESREAGERMRRARSSRLPRPERYTSMQGVELW